MYENDGVFNSLIFTTSRNISTDEECYKFEYDEWGTTSVPVLFPFVCRKQFSSACIVVQQLTIYVM